ncbi:uncharacterized protein [Eurosta solidaginis]|uniref:uncharacterized protein n=1 Tax=Eurosta solidaginis TaxID=178769 RepID=UPI003530E93A
MFASGSKTKNIIVRTSITHRQLPQPTTTTTTKSQRSARRVGSTGGEITRIGGDGGIGSLNGHRFSPQMKSKFTERKVTPVLTRSQVQSSSTNTNSSLIGMAPSHGDGRKTMRGIPSNTAARANARQMQKLEAVAAVSKLIESPNKQTEHFEQINCVETGVQTNESEILNHDLIVGDIKLLPATASVLAEIERQHNEVRKSQLLKVQRKFEVHSAKQEEHLTDLKEFLEQSVITRRARKPKLTIELDRKLISSMDEILNKGVQKTESITDIKGRIKKKEQELLTLFDTVENLQI